MEWKGGEKANCHATALHHSNEPITVFLHPIKSVASFATFMTLGRQHTTVPFSINLSIPSTCLSVSSIPASFFCYSVSIITSVTSLPLVQHQDNGNKHKSISYGNRFLNHTPKQSLRRKVMCE